MTRAFLGLGSNLGDRRGYLRDAVDGTITFTNPDGKEYALGETLATLLVRPRGWHLIEKHVLIDGEPVSAINGISLEAHAGEVLAIVGESGSGKTVTANTLLGLLPETATLSGAVIVTTPQDVSLIDARKGLAMFQKVNVPVLGIVENMSYYVCPSCGHREEIFKHGGGERTARQLGVPFLGEIPIDPKVTAGGDAGRPIVAAEPGSPVTQAYMRIADSILGDLER